MPRGNHCGPPWWHKRFRQGGLRITLGRDVILNVLTRAKKHLSAEEIYLAARPQYPSIGLTSIYRTLDVLIGMGLVQKFDFGDGRARYELTGAPDQEHHHHLICKKCGRVIDYREFMDEELEFLRIAEKGLARKYDFEITGHLIHFYGICEKCRKG